MFLRCIYNSTADITLKNGGCPHPACTLIQTGPPVRPFVNSGCRCGSESISAARTFFGSIP